jgi:hypothetical protein
MTSAVFEPAIPATEQPKTYVLKFKSNGIASPPGKCFGTVELLVRPSDIHRVKKRIHPA